MPGEGDGCFLHFCTCTCCLSCVSSTPFSPCTWGAKYPISFILLLFLPLMLVSFSGSIQPLSIAARVCEFSLCPLTVPAVFPMSAACSPVRGLRGSRPPTPHLLHLPVAGPLGLTGGWMRPPPMGIPRCPCCQAAVPVNYNLPAGPLGPGTMDLGLLRGP